MISKELLKNEAKSNGIELDSTALDRFDKYAELLVYWNERINLTAITDPEEIIYKHFLDSLILLKYVNIPTRAKLIDVGTGAGFPGVALLIARPDLDITLMDSTKKKLGVIEDILKNIGLSANIVHSRAEEAGKSKEFREKYDFVTARAVSNLRDLSEICIPFVKPGGYFIPLKGAGVNEEIDTAKGAIDTLGGKLIKSDIFTLSSCGERAVIHIEKISQTPSKYPRPHAQIAKKPLI